MTALSLTGKGYAAMVSVLDEVMANLTATLKTAALWDNTLVVRSALTLAFADRIETILQLLCVSRLMMASNSCSNKIGFSK